MTYPAAKARILTHARTAAASLTRPIEDVQMGLPLPKSRCVRVYYGGETDPPRMSSRWTLSSEMVGKVTMVAAFWPITALDEELSQTIDAEGEAFSHAFRTAMNVDSDLNAESENTILGDGEPDVLVVGNTRYLAYLWRIVTGHVEYAVAK